MKGANDSVVRALLLFLWAGFLMWLLASGEVYRFIGARTIWVVIVGSVMLVGAGVLQLLTPSQRRLRLRELLGLCVFLAPIVILVMVPSAGLGSQAAARKSGSSLVGAGALASVSRSGDVSFPEIAVASTSEKEAARLGVAEGMTVELTGFVTHPSGTPGTFSITRFATFCCAADAIPYSVPVKGPDYPDDTWLRASGLLVKEGSTFVLDVEDITEVDRPTNPYI